MDQAIINALQPFVGRWPLVDAAGIFLASGLIWILGACLAAFVLFDRRRYLEAACALAAAALAWIANQGIGALWFRPRPFADLAGTSNLIGISDLTKSFPSDHAAISFALASSIFLVDRKWGWALLGMALLVSFGRVFAGVHYPSDVLSGAAIGAVCAVLVHKFTHKILRTRHKSA